MKIVGTLLESPTLLIANPAAYADPAKRQAIEELKILLLGAINARFAVRQRIAQKTRRDALVYAGIRKKISRQSSPKTPSSTPLKRTKSRTPAGNRSQRRRRRYLAPWSEKRHWATRCQAPSNGISLVDLLRNNRHFFGGDSFPDWPRASPASFEYQRR